MVNQEDQGASRAIEVEAETTQATERESQESVLKKARRDIKDKNASEGGRKIVGEHRVTKEDIKQTNKKKWEIFLS